MYSGDSAIADANTRGMENADTFEEDDMIEMRDIGGWREKQFQLAELETPIQEEIKDFPEIKIGKLVMSDEEEDMTPTTTDDSLLDDSPDNSWASININADGSVDLDFSEGEADKIEDIISLLSESSSTNLNNSIPLTLNESTKHLYDSPMRKRNGDNTILLTTAKGHPEGTVCSKAIAKEFCLQMLDITKNESPKRPSTPFRPKSNPQQSYNNNICEQTIPTKGSPKVLRTATKSIVKLCNSRRRTYSAVELTKHENSGDNAIIAKLPYVQCLHSRHQKTVTKCSSDFASQSSTPRPQPTGLDDNRVECTSSCYNRCCPYHAQLREGNAKVDLDRSAEIVTVSDTKCRCLEKNLMGRSHLALSINSSSRVLSNNPSVFTAIASQPKRSLSIEDAIVQLSSPPSDSIGSSSSSSNERKLVRRTLSANRITDVQRAKAGWTPPRKRNSDVGDQFATSHKTHNERMTNRPTMATPTLAPPPPTRCYSDSNVNAMVNKLRCSECKRHCVAERGSFTCSTCLEVHRVRNTFVLEIFADRAASSESRHERTTSYGVRVGAGLLPVIVMFISLIVCSIILFSDSVLSNVCWTYCTNSPAQSQSSLRSSM